MCLLCESSLDSISRLTSSTLHNISALPWIFNETQMWIKKKNKPTLLCVQDFGGESENGYTYLSISTSVRSSATQLWCDWSMERRVWPQPLGHSLLRKLHSDRWASKPRLSTCTGQPERTEMDRPHVKQPCTRFTCLTSHKTTDRRGRVLKYFSSGSVFTH